MKTEENYPPITPLESEIFQIQATYLMKGGGIPEGIDIGYRAAVEKYRERLEHLEQENSELLKQLGVCRKAFEEIEKVDATGYNSGTIKNIATKAKDSIVGYQI